MPQVIRAGQAHLLVCTFAWAVIQGAATPLTALNLVDRDPSWPAWLTATYFLSAICSFPVPSLILDRLGNRIMAHSAVVLGIISMVPMGFGLSPAGLAVCRAIQGVSSTILLVTVETDLLKSSLPENRAGALGKLELCLVAGAGLGAATAPLCWAGNPWLAGVIPALPALLALSFPFNGGGPPFWSARAQHPFNQGRKSRPSFLLLSALTQGLAEGVLMAYLAPWLLGNQWNEASVSLAFASLFTGIVFSQLFLTQLSGRHGHGLVLSLCHGAVALGFMGLASTSQQTPVSMALLLLGLGIGCQYPVAQAALAENVSPRHISTAASVFLACNGLGCLISIPLAEWIQTYRGAASLYNSMGGWCAALLLAGLVDSWVGRKSSNRA